MNELYLCYCRCTVKPHQSPIVHTAFTLLVHSERLLLFSQQCVCVCVCAFVPINNSSSFFCSSNEAHTNLYELASCIFVFCLKSNLVCVYVQGVSVGNRYIFCTTDLYGIGGSENSPPSAGTCLPSSSLAHSLLGVSLLLLLFWTDPQLNRRFLSLTFYCHPIEQCSHTLNRAVLLANFQRSNKQFLFHFF